MALETVAKMVSSARVLLQDIIPGYRNSDADLLDALNTGLIEASRIRPDLFIFSEAGVPQYSAVDATVIAIDQQFLPALLHYVIGHIEMQDAEGNKVERVNMLMGRFTGKLLAVAA